MYADLLHQEIRYIHCFFAQSLTRSCRSASRSWAMTGQIFLIVAAQVGQAVTSTSTG